MEIFICYPSEHRQKSAEVAAMLKSFNVPYWWDQESLIAGEDWEAARKAALSRSSVVLIICADQVNNRDGVYQREINEALDRVRDYRPDRISLIPVRVEELSLPDRLLRFQYIDEFQPDFTKKLAQSLVRVYEQIELEPPPQLLVAASISQEASYRDLTVSDDSSRTKFHAKYLAYEEVSPYFSYINDEISNIVFRSFYGRNSWGYEHEDAWDTGNSIDILIEEFFRKDDLISIVVHQSFDMGGIHPLHTTESLNFFGENAGIQPLTSILKDYNASSKFIKSFINLDMQSKFDSNFDIADFEYEDSVDDVISVFNFNDKGIRIYLSSDLGFPHVLSGASIYIPWEILSEYIRDEVKTLLLM